MSIDYEAIARAGGLSKGKPLRHILDDAKKAWQDIDEKESQKVRKRSGGRCEVIEAGRRCPRRAFHVHHQKGGRGVRGRGESALAQHKTHACVQCHDRMTNRTLQHIDGQRYRAVT